MFRSDAEHPVQRLREAYRRGVRAIDAARMPLFGLPRNWPGARFTGGTEFSTGASRDPDGGHVETYETIDLVHDDGAARLTVQSTDFTLSVNDETLLGLLPNAVVGVPLTLRLDGHARVFAAARTGDVVVARWAAPAATVTVTAVRWPMTPELELVRITDLAPYHDGRLRQLEQRSGSNLHG